MAKNNTFYKTVHYKCSLFRVSSTSINLSIASLASRLNRRHLIKNSIIVIDIYFFHDFITHHQVKIVIRSDRDKFMTRCLWLWFTTNTTYLNRNVSSLNNECVCTVVFSSNLSMLLSDIHKNAPFIDILYGIKNE